LYLKYLRSGDVYTGDWNNDKMHGSGKYVTNEGKACEGEFRNHKFIGITF
jgi:hypothetical protein